MARRSYHGLPLKKCNGILDISPFIQTLEHCVLVGRGIKMKSFSIQSAKYFSIIPETLEYYRSKLFIKYLPNSFICGLNLDHMKKDEKGILED